MNSGNKIFWLASALAIVMIVVSYVYVKNTEVIKYPDVVTNTVNDPQSVAKVKLILNDHVSFPLPEPQSSTTVSIADLDISISKLAAFGIIPSKISKELYSDGTSGYSFAYDVNKNIEDTYLPLYYLANNLPFVLVSAARADLAAIIATESPEYKVKISLEYPRANITKVMVQAQKKGN